MYVQRNTEARSRIIVVEKAISTAYLSVCVCARARVRACVYARERGRLHAHACV
jgi:hypothetical protein